jgi:transposase
MKTSGYHLLLPEGTLDYFIISDVKESSTEIVIYLEEKNEVPSEYSNMKVESKGFYDPVVVQDFPVRGKKLFLNIRRRRWIVKDEGRYVSRNWKLVAEGSRMTHEKNYIDTLPVSCKLLGFLFGVDGELLERQYRNHLSGYMNWNQLSHAEEWILFEKNIGPYVGIDEVSLSQGELYTILINKERKGRSGSIIAIIKGTDVRTVTSVLLKLPRRRRFQVREITLDMAPNMEQTARICFPAARRVTDRFHVQKLAYEAVQEMRVKARWEALDEESIQMAHARACGKIYHAPVFENGDSRKQLLARSIYLLYKKESLWTESQRTRAGILFREYPDIKKAYYLSMRLGLIYHQCKHKDTALTRLARWYDEVDRSGFLAFGRVARSIQTHYLEIINFFEKRSTNAASEAFNAKIKSFRSQFRGVKDKAFFLFRLAKIYA